MSPRFSQFGIFFIYTRTKDTQIVLMEPFVGQIILDIACESQRKAGYAQRVVEIKPRQVGWTAWLLARCAWYALQERNIIAFFVPSDKVVADMNLRFANIYNNLGWMAPMRRIDNKTSLEFSNPNPKLRDQIRGLESAITFQVPSGQRGRTPNVAILSEFAFWEELGFKPQDVLDGLLSGMSAGPESCVVIDTTPNGYDDIYYPYAQQAIDDNPKWAASWERSKIPTREEIVNGCLGQPDNPDSSWVPAFSPWFWHDQYTTKDQSVAGQLPKMTAKQRALMASDTEGIGQLEEFGGEEEIELMKRYGVCVEQLWWRRWKIRQDMQGFDRRQKLLTFRQEYAANYRDCFVDFGDTAFDPLGMDILRRQVKKPSAVGMLRRADENATVHWKVDTQWHSDWEEMRFWAPSEPGEKYVIGVDCANSFGNEDADETVAQVIRRRDRKQVAVYASQAPSYAVRNAVYSLYRYYNNAFLAIECAGIGKNLVFELYQMGATNQYKWKRLDREEIKDTDWLGWQTDVHTRPIMEGILCEEIGLRDSKDNPQPGIIIRDDETMKQLLSCKRQLDGDIKGRGADDYVDALMIALAANRDPMNPYVPPREKDQRAELEQMMGISGAKPAWFSRLGVFGNNKNPYEPNLRDM